MARKNQSRGAVTIKAFARGGEYRIIIQPMILYPFWQNEAKIFNEIKQRVGASRRIESRGFA
jgi:hypothetical protein